MKLYTEEQVRNAIELARDTHQEGKLYLERDEYDYSVDEVIKQLTPIELPSDEEIEKFANEYVKNKWEYAQDENKESFVECAKWMRDKIQGGNK